MAKGTTAKEMGYLSLSATGIIMGAAVDAMQMADVSNDVVHCYLDSLESGFENVLFGEAQEIMLMLVEITRARVASND